MGPLQGLTRELMGLGQGIVTVHGQKTPKIKEIMWSLDFIKRKKHDKQGTRGKKWRFFHNFATIVRERLLSELGLYSL